MKFLTPGGRGGTRSNLRRNENGSFIKTDLTKTACPLEV